MIKTRTELKEYLAADAIRFEERVPRLRDWVLKNEWAYIYFYQRNLRFMEYHKSQGNKLLYLWHFLWYKRMNFNLDLDIKPYNLGPGARIMHLGALIRIKTTCRIGKNCTILPGVVIGNKHLESSEEWVVIGDNCYIGLGAKIFGSVRIGNNVTIGANSVVTKDIPDNAVVGGVPARVLRIKE